MGMWWSLEELYSSTESKEFINDLEKCDQYIAEIQQWVEDLHSDKACFSQHIMTWVKKIEIFLTLQIKFLTLFGKLNIYSQLLLLVNAKDEKAVQARGKMEQRLTDYMPYKVVFDKWLGSLPDLALIISRSELLTEHSFYLRQIVEQTQHQLGDKEEKVAALLSRTGAESWSRLRNVLISSTQIEVPVDGKKQIISLAVENQLANSSDANTRKEIHEARLEAYQKIAEPVAACLNAIKGEVLTQCKLRGYRSPLEKTLQDCRLEAETLEAMFAAIKTSLPVLHKFYRRKGELLGYTNGLPGYDLLTPIGEAQKQMKYDEVQEYILHNFRTFSDRLANVATRAFANNWIDAEPRPGKSKLACCLHIDDLKESRILINFTGGWRSAIALGHELGHAYHFSLLAGETILNRGYTPPLAETASTLCENLVTSASLREANATDALEILEHALSVTGMLTAGMYSRFRFETEIFQVRKDHSLTVPELIEITRSTLVEAFGDGLDYNYFNPYSWMKIQHYYWANNNYYNFPYSFGLLFAKGLYARYLQGGKEFIAEFEKLLTATGKGTCEEIAASIGIDIRREDFWQESLGLIEEEIEQFLKLSYGHK